jgi:L-ribulose-5-phosphate 3-epimerase
VKSVSSESIRQQTDHSAVVRSVIKQYYIYVVLFLIVAVFSVLKLDQTSLFGRGSFLSPDSIINLLRSAVPILLMSGAFTLLMIAGYIDLSVGSAMSLSAVVFSWLVLNGFTLLPALFITLIVGSGLGFLNGFLVMRLRITPVIATLVTLNLFKGLALLIVPDGLSAIKSSAAQTMPGWINDFARKDILGGLPFAFYLAILVIVTLVIIQRKTFIEISIDESDGRLARLDWSASERAALRQSIANTGVRVMTMCLSGHRKYPLGSHSAELRRQGQDILHKAIDFAGDIGLRVVQVMGYDVFYEPSDDETRVNFLDSLQLGAYWAGQAGVMLGLENLDTPFVDCLSKALAIIREIDSPWLSLYPDIGNLAAAGCNPPDEIVLARKQILGLHVKDALPRVIRGVPFGEGIVPFRETFRSLAQTGFWGLLGVEIWGDRHTGQDPVAAAAAARRFVADLVDEAWPDARPCIRPELENAPTS